jgi:hypothetical protein
MDVVRASRARSTLRHTGALGEFSDEIPIVGDITLIYNRMDLSADV